MIGRKLENHSGDRAPLQILVGLYVTSTSKAASARPNSRLSFFQINLLHEDFHGHVSASLGALWARTRRSKTFISAV